MDTFDFEKIHRDMQAMFAKFPPPSVIADMQAAAQIVARQAADAHSALTQAMSALPMESIWEQIRSAQETMAPKIQDALRASSEARDVIAAALSQFRLPDFDYWKRTEEEATTILVARGWWPHPDWPVDALHQVIVMKREGRLRSLNRMICETYEVNNCAPMKKSIDRWMDVPEFGSRRGVFLDALWAYRRKKYGLLTTHLLPHIEGILRDLAERNGLGAGGWKRQGREVSKGPDFTRPFADAFMDSLLSMYERSPSSPDGEKSYFPVQRHPILHGNEKKMGNRANAMRVFLMIDCLHYFITEYEEFSQKVA